MGFFCVCVWFVQPRLSVDVTHTHTVVVVSVLVSNGLATIIYIHHKEPFVVSGHSLVTLTLTVNEILKWLSLLPVLLQESFWW